MKRYAVVRENVEYGYIEDGVFYSKRWDQSFNIEGGKFASRPMSGSNKPIRHYTVDLTAKTMIRDEDQTVFTLIEIEQI